MIKRIRPGILLALGWCMAVTPPLVSTVFLMPIIPGVQDLDIVPLCHTVHRFAWPLILIGTVLVALAIRTNASTRRVRAWIGLSILVLLGIGIHVAAATMFSAEAMFNEASTVHRVTLDPDRARQDTTICLWVNMNGVVAGYPVDLIAHHHKVLDTVGGTDVLVTYCTMCHTGRVYSPRIDGRRETFRLVGANHYNAIIEDASTGSWWYQATGECIAGPKKGAFLTDIPFMQGTAAEMLREWQPTAISMFRADTATGERYAWAEGYAQRAGDTSTVLGRRTLVVGVRVGTQWRAYPMPSLLRSLDSVITDTLGGVTIVLTRPTTATDAVIVRRDSVGSPVIVPSVIDLWHAWSHFHPTTTVWSAQ